MVRLQDTIDGLTTQLSSGGAPVELADHMPAKPLEDRLVLETPVGRESVADIRLIYRYHVAGEPLEEMARRAGITPRQMRRRIQRAKARARA